MRDYRRVSPSRRICMYAEREESERLGESWRSRVEREEREAAAMKAGRKRRQGFVGSESAVMVHAMAIYIVTRRRNEEK